MTSLIYIDVDTPPTDATLSGLYGFVDMTVSYGATTSDIVQMSSRVFDLDLDGSGGLTEGSNSEYIAAIGSANGTVGYSTSALGASGYSVAAGTGALTLTAANLSGVAATDGELILLSNDNQRGYGVRLASDVTAQMLENEGAFDLIGLVLQPDVNSISGYTLEGAEISFDLSFDQNNNPVLTAEIDYSGTSRDNAAFDSGDAALPLVGSGTAPTDSIVSNPITMDSNGRIDRITFGAGAGADPADMEGFYIPGRGLLLRYVETNFTVEAGIGDTTFFAGWVDDNPNTDENSVPPVPDPDPTFPFDQALGVDEVRVFVDPNSGIPLADQPTTEFHVGFVFVGVLGNTERISDIARDNSSADFNALTDPTVPGVGLGGDGFGQGIVWGIPQ